MNKCEIGTNMKEKQKNAVTMSVSNHLLNTSASYIQRHCPIPRYLNLLSSLASHGKVPGESQSN